MVTEAIILAGGMGTRLRSMVNDIPKPMAPVNGRPFLEIILDSLNDQQINHVILSVGYKYEVIQKHFGDRYKDISIDYAIESEPLGTGGAVSLAIDKLKANNFFMMNGDTLFDVNLSQFSVHYIESKADLSLALKPVKDQDRYGLVIINDEHKVIRFAEKQHISEGLINGGVYLTSRSFITGLNLPSKYSWEKDILEKETFKSRLSGFVSNSYFIDIGIPADYKRAQVELL